MRQNPKDARDAAERTVRDIRRKTRKRHSTEEKIRIVLAGRLVALSTTAKSRNLPRGCRFIREIRMQRSSNRLRGRPGLSR